MKRIILLLLFLIGTTLNAQSPPAARFLDINVGARAGAMGDAFTSVANDTTALYWNPSGILEVGKKEIGISYNLLFANLSYSFVGYIQQFKNVGNFGVSLSFLNSDDIKITKEDSNNSEKLSIGNFGSFSFSDFSINVTCAKNFMSIPLGITFKFIKERLYTHQSSGIGFDAGTKYEIIKHPKVILGFCIKNMGFIKSSAGNYYSIPLSFNLGFLIGFKNNYLISTDLKCSYYYKTSFKFGFEYQYSVNNKLILFPRIGYKTSERVGRYMGPENFSVGGLNGFAIGGGIFYKFEKFEINFDYVLIPYSELENVHKFSLNTKF